MISARSNRDQPMRPFIVFWIDEYVGQRSTVVFASDETTARDEVEDLTGQVTTSVASL